MTPPLVYVDADVPEGMTLGEYRALQCAEPPPRAGLVERLRRLLGRG
jgi:hypothetical protein